MTSPTKPFLDTLGRSTAKPLAPDAFVQEAIARIERGDEPALAIKRAKEHALAEIGVRQMVAMPRERDREMTAAMLREAEEVGGRDAADIVARRWATSLAEPAEIYRLAQRIRAARRRASGKMKCSRCICAGDLGLPSNYDKDIDPDPRSHASDDRGNRGRAAGLSAAGCRTRRGRRAPL